MEQYFLKNIVTQIDLLLNKEEIINNYNIYQTNFKKNHFTEPNNFSFPNEVYKQVNNAIKIAEKVAAFQIKKKKRAQIKFPLAMKYKINSFSFSGDSWSTQST